MTRDQALIEALGEASITNKIMIVWPLRVGWTFNEYSEGHNSVEWPAVRYVLPNGEVCKLS